MLHPSETIRWPAAGQFYACLNPLSLYRVEIVGQDVNGDPGCFTMHSWTPDGSEVSAWIVELNVHKFRFLWYNKVVPRRSFSCSAGSKTPGLIKGEVGDVWLVQIGQWNGKTTVPAHEPRLVFIGPDGGPEEIQILADWDLGFEAASMFIMAMLYQPGAGRRSPPPKSVYDHLREPSV